MKTATSPYGRETGRNGAPVDIVKLLGQTDIAYLARVAVNTPANTEKAKKAIKKALTKQMNGEGYCLIEVLSPCPTNWGMDPAAAMDFVKTNVMETFPLGEFVDKGGDK